MANYTDDDINKGAGAFEQAMLSQQAVSGTANRMRPAVAIGILSAAMRSGLPASKLERVIDESFASNASLLKRLLAMYEGDDWDIHLWHRLPSVT